MRFSIVAMLLASLLSQQAEAVTAIELNTQRCGSDWKPPRPPTKIGDTHDYYKCESHQQCDGKRYPKGKKGGAKINICYKYLIIHEDSGPRLGWRPLLPLPDKKGDSGQFPSQSNTETAGNLPTVGSASDQQAGNLDAARPPAVESTIGKPTTGTKRPVNTKESESKKMKMATGTSGGDTTTVPQTVPQPLQQPGNSAEGGTMSIKNLLN